MQINNKKNFLYPALSAVILLIIIITAAYAHLLFVAKDARPFIHPAWFYFNFGYLKIHTFLYDTTLTLLNIFTPKADYNYYIVYRSVNVLYLIPMIIFFYLSISAVFHRTVALLSALFLITAPEVINIFHLTGINFQTMTLFSILIYLYLKTDYFHNRIFAFLFAFLLYIFSLNHHSFLLYLTTIIPLWFVLLLSKDVRKKTNIKNIIYASLLLISLLAVYNEISFSHISKYFARQNCFEKIKTIDLTQKSISTTCIYFLNEIKLNCKKLIITEFKYFDLYFILTCISIAMHLIGNAVKFIRKQGLSSSNIIELQCIWFILCFLFLLSLESQIPTEMYMAPLFLFIALLNSLALIKTYKFIQYNFKKAYADKIFILVFTICFGTYNFLLLFIPSTLIKDSSNTNRSYNYSSEDYNISKHVEFFSQNNIQAEAIAVTAKDADAATPNAYLFNLWFGLKGDIKKTTYRKKDYINTADTDTAYMVFFYSLDKHPENKTLLLDETADLAAAFIQNRYDIADDQQINLLKILPYGFKSKMTTSLKTDRKHLTFIFSIKDFKDLQIKRFT